MAKWIYTLEETGKELRKSIEDERLGDIIRNLEICYKEIQSKVKLDKYAVRELEENLSLLEGEADLLDNEDIEEIEGFGFNDMDELVEERLYSFYEFCDGYKIFIAL